MKAKVVIAPLDLMKIRKELGISLSDMGSAIALYTEGCFNTPVPDTRINEWEKAVRHVPSYVYTACANIVLDHWTSDWHEAKNSKRHDVDKFYGSLLSPAFGILLELEHKLAMDPSKKDSEYFEDIRRVRKALQKDLEKILHVEMSYVWAKEPGPDTVGEPSEY